MEIHSIAFSTVNNAAAIHVRTGGFRLELNKSAGDSQFVLLCDDPDTKPGIIGRVMCRLVNGQLQKGRPATRTLSSKPSTISRNLAMGVRVRPNNTASITIIYGCLRFRSSDCRYRKAQLAVMSNARLATTCSPRQI
jgi:hypothetical protein